MYIILNFGNVLKWPRLVFNIEMLAHDLQYLGQSCIPGSVSLGIAGVHSQVYTHGGANRFSYIPSDSYGAPTPVKRSGARFSCMYSVIKGEHPRYLCICTKHIIIIHSYNGTKPISCYLAWLVLRLNREGLV